MEPVIGGRNGEDATLLTRWTRGDNAAAQQLILRYQPEVSRFFRMRQPLDADDLVQETLLAIIEARDRFRGDASFRTYLLRIARFKLWSHRRRRRETVVALEEADVELPEALGAETYACDDRLEEALGSLSPPLSRVIRLTLDRELTREAIATELGIPAGTVASCIRTARTQLKALLSAAET